jgi:hypothetical protein
MKLQFGPQEGLSVLVLSSFYLPALRRNCSNLSVLATWSKIIFKTGEFACTRRKKQELFLRLCSYCVDTLYVDVLTINLAPHMHLHHHLISVSSERSDDYLVAGSCSRAYIILYYKYPTATASRKLTRTGGFT